MYDPEYKVIRFVGTPMCTDTPTYEAWREEARRSPPGEAGFCMDCTPEYQQTMIAAERCEHPWVKFRLQGETDTTMVKTSVDDFWSKKLSYKSYFHISFRIFYCKWTLQKKFRHF